MGQKNRQKELEKRSYTFEVRAEEQDGEAVITGRPIVYDQKTNIGGMFLEVIDWGALNGTDLTDVRFLVNHDVSRIPLARSRRNNGNSTMHLSVDDMGMAIRVRLDVENNSEARALYSAVQRGDISGMSFLFAVSEERWEDLNTDLPIRHVVKIETVVEVSAVTFPAYSGTEINARSSDALESARVSLERERRAQCTALDSVEKEKLKLRIMILGGN